MVCLPVIRKLIYPVKPAVHQQEFIFVESFQPDLRAVIFCNAGKCQVRRIDCIPEKGFGNNWLIPGRSLLGVNMM